ncbi:YaaR family protein [Bacillus timonensis]|nr:YaaR family protein [Bacillus timonensis]
MKINQELRLALDSSRQEQKGTSISSTSFSDLVQKNEGKLHLEQLKQIMSQIDDAGQRLHRSRTFTELAKFKTLVKKFVNEAVQYGMNVKQSHSWNSQGQGRSLKIVEEIDTKLVKLTEDVLNQEKKSVDILSQIGEIKGLLINIYM